MSDEVILIAGALANKCHNGGGTWERMSWVVGLRRLGFDVYFIEQISPEMCRDAAGNACSLVDSENLAWFRFVTGWFDVAKRSALVCDGGRECMGIEWSRLLDLADAAVLLVNLSGHLELEPILKRIRRKAYIDVDPGFTQFWHADPSLPFHVDGHDYYYTIGENIGSTDCPIPTNGIHWRPIRQPIVLDDWPVVQSPALDRFSTVAAWRGGFGRVQANGRIYGLKVHEFRKFIELPQHVSASFEIALDIDRTDEKDRQALEQCGWQLLNPREVAGEPTSFRSYVQQSAAEFSVAQGIYVETSSGWFSDRSVRYLASGKPVLVQDTGMERHIPTGKGLVTFRTFENAVQGAAAISADYASHCRAARAIAAQYFDSTVVLGRMLSEVGVSP